MVYRKPTLQAASDAEMAEALKELVELGQVSAEAVNDRTRNIREATSKRLKAALNIAKEQGTLEQFELLKSLEAQYPTMKATLEKYEISTKGIPSWEQVQQGLTPEVLNKVLKIVEPTLLLVPPTTLQSKVDALDEHKVKGQRYDIKVSNEIWNERLKQKKNGWKVSIVEGIQIVKMDTRIYGRHCSDNVYEIARMWITKLKDQGLDVMTGVDEYLTLVMKALDEEKPIDSWHDVTVLNSKNMRNTLICGKWSKGVILSSSDADAKARGNLRLRGSVEVEIEEVSRFEKIINFFKFNKKLLPSKKDREETIKQLPPPKN